MLLCTCDGATMRENRPALAMSVLGALTRGTEPGQINWVGIACWGPSLAVLRTVLVPAHTDFSPLP